MSEETLSGTILTTAFDNMLSALGWTFADVGKFARLDTQTIQALTGAATNLPEKFVNKVFSTNEVSLSGDWVACMTEDANNNPWIVLLLERGSTYRINENGPHFAQTTFALSSVGVGDLIYQNLHADYGQNTSGGHLRYTPPTSYDNERNKIKPGVTYDKVVCLQDPGLSAITDIWYRGIDDAMRKV